MTAKEFIYSKYPHLTHPIAGNNPVVDFELNNLCEWFEEYANLRLGVIKSQLPTDEGIEQMANKKLGIDTNEGYGFKEGAKYMRDLIKNN